MFSYRLRKATFKCVRDTESRPRPESIAAPRHADPAYCCSRSAPRSGGDTLLGGGIRVPRGVEYGAAGARRPVSRRQGDNCDGALAEHGSGSRVIDGDVEVLGFTAHGVRHERHEQRNSILAFRDVRDVRRDRGEVDLGVASARFSPPGESNLAPRAAAATDDDPCDRLAGRDFDGWR